jgi:hypothetical protein
MTYVRFRIALRERSKIVQNEPREHPFGRILLTLIKGIEVSELEVSASELGSGGLLEAQTACSPSFGKTFCEYSTFVL